MNYVYKITNIINHKIYIGVHKTNNLNDRYMGSGKRLVLAIKKYGIENFNKEILEFFDTYESALMMEAEIVTDEFLLREDVYNLTVGGHGGFNYANTNDRILEKRKLTMLSRYGTTRPLASTEIQEKARNTLQQRYGVLNPMCSDVIRQKNRETCKEKYGVEFHTQSCALIQKRKETFLKNGNGIGDKNSCYGKVWIHNKDIKKNKRIEISEQNLYLQQGWILGRKMQF